MFTECKYGGYSTGDAYYDCGVRDFKWIKSNGNVVICMDSWMICC